MDAEHIWLVDPIDGTKCFVRELPFFSTQTALLGEHIRAVGSVAVVIGWPVNSSGAAHSE